MNVKVIKSISIVIIVIGVIAGFLSDSVLDITVSIKHAPITSLGDITWGDIFYSLAEIWGFYGYVAFSAINVFFGIITIISFKGKITLKSMIQLNLGWIITGFVELFLVLTMLKEDPQQKGLYVITSYILTVIICLFVNRSFLKKEQMQREI